MSGLDAPEIAAAYEAVRSDKDDTKWLLLSHEGRNKLVLSKTGTGSVEELAGELDDAQVQYGYVRVEYALDAESTRVKFVLITWIGEHTPVMRKASVIDTSSKVKQVLSHYSIVKTPHDRGELKVKNIEEDLRKSGGANYGPGR